MNCFLEAKHPEGKRNCRKVASLPKIPECRTAGSPVHPQPVLPGARQPHNHYTNAMREWMRREVLLVASTAVPAQVTPDLSCPAIPVVNNSCIGSKIIPTHSPMGAGKYY